MRDAEMKQVADYMKTFANPLRVNIIMTLNSDEKSVNQIVQDTGAKQCYVSQQLGYLTKKGVLNRRPNQHNVYYSVKKSHVVNMLEMVRIGI